MFIGEDKIMEIAFEYGYVGFWVMIIVLAMVAELITVSLSTIWFAFGGVAALCLAGIGAPFWVQILGFLLLSLVSLYFTRPWAIKHLNNKRVKSNLEELIGRPVQVTETIDNRKDTGRALHKGMEWTARAAREGEVIEKGSEAYIERIEGVKLMVSTNRIMEPKDQVQPQEDRYPLQEIPAVTKAKYR